MSEKVTKRQRQQYEESFKREAVTVFESSKKTLTQVARELGVHENNLRNWSEKYGKQETTESGTTLQELLAENKRLRKEVAERAEEVAILKKATAYFATHGKG